MSEERVLEGGCLCGAVRFAATGAPENVAFCHCETARFASSPELWRVTCPACGAPLFGMRQDGGSMGIALAAFDDQAALTPTHHFFVESKAPWVRIDDDLPQYPQWAPD
jgi:hypothetical protein